MDDSDLKSLETIHHGMTFAEFAERYEIKVEYCGLDRVEHEGRVARGHYHLVMRFGPDRSARAIGGPRTGGLYSMNWAVGGGHWKNRDQPTWYRPKPEDVLYCLQSDASATDESFAEWCANFDYNQDSIKALDMYNACVKCANDMRRILGAHRFDEFMHCVEE